MRNILVITAMFALTACQAPERPVTEGNVAGSFFSDLFGKRCSLEILFGSYAMGIDSKSHGEIKAALAKRGSQLAIQERPWGREGEQAVCVDIKDAATADRLEKEIAAIITANEPTKGPVTITRGPLMN
jgi:hypothetical protein